MKLSGVLKIFQLSGVDTLKGGFCHKAGVVFE
jgi:hypothetical protein